MKILLIDPGADTSTVDVFNGYRDALKRVGHEVFTYSLQSRIPVATGWLEYNWRRTRKVQPDVVKPSWADSLYWAGIWSIEMALRIMPDWVVVVTGQFLLKDTLTLLRKATWPHCKMAVILTESPYSDNQQVNFLPLVDVAFTNEMASVPIMRQFQPNVEYLPAAYDPERHRPDIDIPEDTPAYDVLFIGTGFPERIELLSAVDWTGINLGIYGNWPDLGSRSKLRPYLHSGSIDNAGAVQLYRRASICLNLHRSRLSSPNVPLPAGMAKSLNPRAYELAACGAFQISDWRDELPVVFGSTSRTGDLVPTFKTADDFEGMVRSYLKVPEVRERIAGQLPAVVAGHTYDARAATLLEVLGRAEPLAPRAG